MRFVVLGAGAIGAAVGGRLHQAGHDVTLVARGEHGRALASGLTLEAPDESVRLQVPTVSSPAEVDWRAGGTDGEPGDDTDASDTDANDTDTIVLLAVKGQHTDHALGQLLAVAPPTTPVVCLQNGVENERRVLRHFPATYAVCVLCPATQLRPGVVQVHSAPVSGLLDVGRYPSGVDETCRAVARAVSTTTFRSQARPDIMRWKYRKLLSNLANALEALCGPEVRFGPLAKEAEREGAAVLEAAGIDVTGDEEYWAHHAALGLAPTPSGPWQGGSSWQSLARRTGSIEAEFLNGEIVLLGALHGVPTPVNALLQRLAIRAAWDGTGAGGWDVAELNRLAGVDHGR